MMSRIFIILLLLPLVFAENVAPTIYEQRDLGPPAFEEFTYSISVDCTAATIRAYVMDEDNKVVQGADTYLKYIDFAQPLISSVESDKDGFVLHKLPGNVKLMRGFFVLVIQKTDYRSKEIHFDINRCWSDEDVPQPPEPPEQNVSPPPANVTPPDEPEITIPEAPNTGNASIAENLTNMTEAEPAGEEGGSLCAPLLGLLILFKFFRGKTSS